MDEPSEQQLYGWLCIRGYTKQEAAKKIIERVDEQGEANITLP
jgi:hypothetical protein